MSTAFSFFNLRDKLKSIKPSVFALIFLAFIALALCACFSVKTFASAAESQTGESTPSINWDTPNPYSLIPSDSCEGEEAEVQDGSLLADATDTRITMYRLYNKYTGEHFYTASESEKTKLKKAGWNDEGLGWYAPSKSDTPVYRLYNPYVPGGDHHYTNSIMEYNSLKREGWRQEGIGWYSVNENESDKVPLYRVYNPFAVTGTHHYTLDSKEKSNLVKLKWRDEGVGWYGYATQKIDFTKAKVDTTAKTYNGTQFKPSATVTGLKVGTDYTVTYGTNKNAGTGTITIKGKGNYSGSKTYTFVINRLNISSATVTLGNSLTYNTKEQTQTLKSVKVGKLTLNTSDYTLSDNKQIKAGSYKLKITGTGNFTGTKTCDFKIARLNIKGAQVSLGRSLVYNGKSQTKTVSDVTVNGTALTTEDYLVVGNEQTKAGDYTLKVQGTGNCEGEITRDFSIEKKMLSVSGIKAEDKEYNGNTDATLDLSNASLSNWFKDDDVSLKSATGKFASKDVATGVKVTLNKIELGGDDADNYYILPTGAGELKADITQKVITVSGISAETKTYDGSTKATFDVKEAQLSDVCTGDDLRVKGASGTFETKDVGNDKTVTFGELELAGKDLNNYKVTVQAGLVFTANIEPKEIKVASGVTATGKTYDGKTSATIDITGAELSEKCTDDSGVIDTVSLKSATGKYADKNVGTDKAITLSDFELDGKDAGNYTVATTGNQELKATITAKEIKIASGITATGKTYDGKTSATIDITAAELSEKCTDDAGVTDTVSLKSATGKYADKNVGTDKPITLNDFELDGADAGNYTVATTGNQQPTATIKAKEITVASGVTATGKTYDGKTSATIDITGAELSEKCTDDSGVTDTVSLKSATGKYADKNVGTDKAITMSDFVLDGTDAGNYTVATTGNQELKATITAKEIKIASGVTATGKTYDGKTSATIDITGAELSEKCTDDSGVTDTVSLKSATGKYADKKVGTDKAITMSDFVLEGADAGNYTVATTGNQELKATITAKEIKIASGITATGKTYDGKTSATIDIKNAVLSEKCTDDSGTADTVSLKSATGKYADKKVGTNKAIALSDFVLDGADAGNYTVATTGNQEVKATITAKEITVASGVTATGKTYDAKTDATIDISGAVLSEECKDDTGVSDTVSLKSAKGKYADKNVGTDKAITLSDFELDGADADNYTVASTGNQQPTATIAAQEIRITVTGVTGAKERVYAKGDSSVELEGSPSVSYEASDIYSGDVVALGAVTGKYASEDAGDDKEVQFEVALSGTDAGNYVTKDMSTKIKGNVLAIVKFETNCSVKVEDRQLHIGSLVEDNVTALLPTREGLEKDCWYDNGACEVDADKERAKWDFATSKVSKNITTLAVAWKNTTGEDFDYWFAPASKVTTANSEEASNVVNEDYVSETWNIRKTSAEIKSDINTIYNEILAGTADNKDSVTNEYRSFMNDDKYHLYTKIGSGTTKNDYAEFGIIGIGEHDSDGTVLTFQTTHVLPTLYRMNSNNTNNNGWGASELHGKFTTGGTIYKLFNSNLIGDMATVKKTYAYVGGSGTVTDKLWIPAYSELTNTSQTYVKGGEGTRYERFTNLGINATGNNPALKLNYRNDETGNGMTWRLRTTHAQFKSSFVTVNGGGNPSVYWDGSNNNYGVAVCFAFGQPDYTVTYDSQGHGTAPAAVGVDDGESVSDPTSSVAKQTGLTLEGWYNNAACKVDEDAGMKKWNFATDTITANTTLYANWIPEKDTSDGNLSYWIAPSSKYTTGNTSVDVDIDNNAEYMEYARNSYVSEETNVLKSSTEIKADIQKMKEEATNGTAENENSVTNQYKSMMTSDKYHLYTKWNGGDSDADANKYVESRIISVGPHDSDGSTLTFMAIHALPTAKAMNTEDSNSGGWTGSDMKKTVFADAGYVASGLSGLSSGVISVSKATTTGSYDTAWEASTTPEKFWLASYSEVYGESSDWIGAEGELSFKAEGTQYAWFKSVGISSPQQQNYSISKISYMRSNELPSGYSGTAAWLRSPWNGNKWDFARVEYDGRVETADSATSVYSVVPAFAF